MQSLANRLKVMQGRADKTTKREEIFDKTIEDLRAELNRVS